MRNTGSIYYILSYIYIYIYIYVVIQQNCAIRSVKQSCDHNRRANHARELHDEHVLKLSPAVFTTVIMKGMLHAAAWTDESDRYRAAAVGISSCIRIIRNKSTITGRTRDAPSGPVLSKLINTSSRREREIIY